MFDFKGYTRAGWCEKPMRWAQLTLTDDDPRSFDPDFWLDYFKKTRSDGAVLSTGGYIAYHPTRIPLHYASRELKGRDVFGYLVEGCRKMGMAVIARTDPHAVHQDGRDVHPEWIAVDEQGEPRRHWAMPGVWVSCALGPYNRLFMNEVNAEIMREYAVDGIFANRWAGSGYCRCAYCREAFKRRTGRELPGTADPGEPAHREYLDFLQAELFEICVLWDETIRKINPNARFIPNSGGGALSGLDMAWLGRFSDILFADRQARSGVLPPWANGKNGKEFRAALGMKPIGGIFSVGIEEEHRWKDSVQSEAELRIWAADGVANGLRPWFTKFCGTIRDRRWLPVVEDLYRRYADWEPYLRNTEPLAGIGLAYSQSTAKFYGGRRAHEKVEDHIQGAYHALVEARLPFEMVHEGFLDRLDPKKLKALILPNIACMSDRQCEAVRGYVRAGGGLVATLETSLYDGRGDKRTDFGLADLFGVSAAGPIQGPMKNSYLRLEHSTAGGHPILAGLEAAERIINGVFRVPVAEKAVFADKPVTFIPPYPDLPMEEVYPRTERTDTAEVYLSSFGAGRVAYLPWDIDRIFWSILNPDHGRLLANIVGWAAGEEPPVTVDGPGFLELTAWKQAASMTVHLVNLTNPMLMKGPFREFYPVGPERIRLRLPAGAAVKRVGLLAAKKEIPFDLKKGWLEVEVPQVIDHEVVAVDLSIKE